MTAWSEMAEARVSRAADARVPCPLCGGLVHPIAGRCKHCKQDLAELRAARLEPAARLPALNGKPGANGHAPAIALPAARKAAAAEPRASKWRHWPIAVIAIAGLLLVGAVALLVWPQSAPPDVEKSTAPPAIDRMPNEQPVDPWAPSAPSTPPPHAQAPDPRRSQPQVTPPTDDPGDPNGLSSLGQLALPSSGSFMFAMATHLCKRLDQCGTANDFITTYCEGMTVLQQQAPQQAPTCDQGKRCLEAIDQMSCNAKADDATALFQLMNQMPVCFQAMTRC
ncbi:MAG TPA: hypothetical protein VMJ10_34815 [Kofleriaceae bacterium]|nr:hypothetical protein [Kofleriaceae bacterium]